MIRATLTLALVAGAFAQHETWVDVGRQPTNEITDTDELEDVEKRYTGDLSSDLRRTKEDVLLLYTEYSARSGAELKIFMRNISAFSNESLSRYADMFNNAPSHCQGALTKRLRHIQFNAHRAASFSAENHHKYYLGHMIVFRMHLNKSEDYIDKCERALILCNGRSEDCETRPKITRWRRNALDELNRVKDDIQHSRQSFKDLQLHGHRKLRNLRKQANSQADDAIKELEACVRHG